MFKTYALLIGVALALAAMIIPCRQKDLVTYRALLESSNPMQNEDMLSYAEQKRGHVHKRVWYQDQTPLHIRIDSEESELFLFKQAEKMEVIEELEHVVCIMQEQLYYEQGKPMQKVRYMEAERASYNYSSHLFIADDVKIWKYQLEGHTPPETVAGQSPVMHAIAKSVEFSLRGEKLDFVAHQMRAKVNSRERTL